jgi:hypothetical protein
MSPTFTAVKEVQYRLPDHAPGLQQTHSVEFTGVHGVHISGAVKRAGLLTAIQTQSSPVGTDSCTLTMAVGQQSPRQNCQPKE